MQKRSILAITLNEVMDSLWITRRQITADIQERVDPGLAWDVFAIKETIKQNTANTSIVIEQYCRNIK